MYFLLISGSLLIEHRFDYLSVKENDLIKFFSPSLYSKKDFQYVYF
jgi:hypothetical protein